MKILFIKGGYRIVLINSNKNFKIYKVLIMIFFLIALFSMIHEASASKIIINDESYYESHSIIINDEINNQIKNAKDDDIIEFKGSTYNNLNISINKKVKIISSNQTKIIGSSLGSAFNIQNTKDVSINGFIIQNYETGITITNSSNINLTNNIINLVKNTGILVYDSNNINISNTTIDKNNNGISIKNSNNTLIKNIKISKSNGNGIELINSKNSFITNSKIEFSGLAQEISITSSRDNMSGFYSKNSMNVKISNSNLIYNVNGIGISNSSNISFINNTILHNTYFGVLFEGGYSDNVLIHNNSIQYSNVGIKFNNIISNLTVVKNIIINNIERTDIGLYDGGAGIQFGSELRYFLDNTIKHNIVTYNNQRTFDGQRMNDPYQYVKEIDSYEIVIGSNLIKPDDWVCGVLINPPYLKILRIGPATYMAYIVDGDTGKVASNMPTGIITFYVGKKIFKTYMINGSAFVVFNAMDLIGEVRAEFYGLSAVLNWNTVITNMLPVSPPDNYKDWENINNDQSGTGSEPSTGNGNGNGNGSGNGNGTGNGNGNGEGSGTGNGNNGNNPNGAGLSPTFAAAGSIPYKQSFSKMESSANDYDDGSSNSPSTSPSAQNNNNNNNNKAFESSESANSGGSSGGSSGVGDSKTSKISELLLEETTKELTTNDIALAHTIIFIFVILILYGFKRKREVF